MTLRLHWSPDSANIVIRIALEEMGLGFEPVRVDRAAGEHRQPAYPPVIYFMPVHVIPFSPSIKGLCRNICCSLLHVDANHCIVFGGRKGRV